MSEISAFWVRSGIVPAAGVTAAEVTAAGVTAAEVTAAGVTAAEITAGRVTAGRVTAASGKGTNTELFYLTAAGVTAGGNYVRGFSRGTVPTRLISVHFRFR